MCETYAGRLNKLRLRLRQFQLSFLARANNGHKDGLLAGWLGRRAGSGSAFQHDAPPHSRNSRFYLLPVNVKSAENILFVLAEHVRSGEFLPCVPDHPNTTPTYQICQHIYRLHGVHRPRYSKGVVRLPAGLTPGRVVSNPMLNGRVPLETSRPGVKQPTGVPGATYVLESVRLELYWEPQWLLRATEYALDQW